MSVTFVLLCGSIRTSHSADVELLASSHKERPAWVVAIPTGEGYYFAVGVKSGARTLESGIEGAVAEAAASLLRTAGMRVDARLAIRATELATRIQDEVKIRTQGGTIKDAVFQEMYFERWKKRGIYGEPYDSWEVFVLVRYPKAEMEEERNRLQEELEKNRGLVVQALRDARNEERQGRVPQTVGDYVTALKLCSQTDADESLRPQIMAALHELVVSLGITKVSGDNQRGLVGGCLASPLVVEVTLGEHDGNKAVANVPLKFAFDVGSGELESEVKTSAAGRASTTVRKLEEKGTSQVKATIFAEELFSAPQLTQEELLSLTPILRALQQKEVLFKIAVGSPPKSTAVAIVSNELNLGSAVEQSHLSSTLTKLLIDNGYSVVPKERAVLLIDAEGRAALESDNAGDYYSALASGEARVTDIHSGEIVVQRNLGNIRGLSQVSGEDAGQDALNKLAATLARSLVEELLTIAP